VFGLVPVVISYASLSRSAWFGPCVIVNGLVWLLSNGLVVWRVVVVVVVVGMLGVASSHHRTTISIPTTTTLSPLLLLVAITSLEEELPW